MSAHAAPDRVDGNAISDRDLPLCVDLDGTLLRTDVLAESALALLSRNPLYLFAFGWWLVRGRAYLKQAIAQRVDLPMAGLPWRTDLIDWLREQRTQRALILCTAGDRRLADAVAAHLPWFDEVLASDGTTNLSGQHKAKALIERFGDKQFDYVGNAHADLKVWKHARHGIVVGAGAGLQHAAARLCDVSKIFPPQGNRLRTWIRALRIHQWLKNALLFVPLLAAHRWFDAGQLGQAALGFASFCLCASGTYVLNDLLDLSADRAHPRKHQRPFAAGTLRLAAGMLAAPLLVIAAFVLSLWLPRPFIWTLGAYLLLTLGYSLALKRIIMLDVLVLAALYTVRILAGGAATAIPVSFWLLAFSMFLFLSLAMLKRYAELHDVRAQGGSLASGRGYGVEDLTLIQSLGSASGYVSVLVLALYVHSNTSEVLYTHPNILWLLCPLLLYWISRAWVIAHRGEMHDDPVEFAVVDRVSQIVMVLAALTVAVAV